MAISQRTATSGTLTSGQVVTITLPTGTTDGDFLVVAIAEGNVSGPSAPTGWTLTGPLSAGTGQSISIYTAAYTASLTLTFTNIAASAAWACNAFFESGRTVSLDGTPLAAHNTTGNTTLPTGAPTTGSAAGDYEVLAYAWTSNTTISGVASGSTIDITRASASASPSVALGHNNTTSLAASTTVTAFSQTLSAANTRKSGVGILLQSVSAGPITIGVSTTQATSVSLAGTFGRTGAASQAQGVVLRRATSLTRAVSQSQSVSLRRTFGVIRSVTQASVASLTMQLGVLSRTVTATQATAVALSRRLTLSLTLAASQSTTLALGRQVTLRRAISQGMLLSRSLVRSLTRTLTLTQATSAKLQVGTDPIPRTVTATQAQTARLVRQVRLTRTVSKATSATLRRSYSLVLQTALATQSIVLLHASAVLVTTQQATAVRLLRAWSLMRIVSQSNSATVQRAISLARVVGQVTSVTLLRGGAGIQRIVTARVTTNVSLLKRLLTVGLATQVQSLRLGRNVTLTRTVGQATLAHLLVQGIPSGGVQPAETFDARRGRSPVIVVTTRQPVFGSRGRPTVFTAERSH